MAPLPFYGPGHIIKEINERCEAENGQEKRVEIPGANSREGMKATLMPPYAISI